MTTRALAVVSELDRYVAEVSRYPLLSAEEEIRLARRWRDHGDTKAAHALVASNLRFVVKIANEYRGYGARILDLVQEGSVGLMQAVKRFDPERGYRLLTYAVFWIRSYIHAFIMGTLRMIKIGTSRAHRKLFFKLRALKGRLGADGMTDRDEVLAAVAQKVGVSVAEAEEMDRHLAARDASLDAPSAETGATLAEIVPSSLPSQEEQLAELEAEADRAARLKTAMGRLDTRERRVVEARYLAEEPVQLKTLGEEMGVTKQRVAQLERRALGKLREALSEAA
ncbi:MAG: RNA polymerase factor sigma-32 [Deltaproteobacteria bacterium]|nr:RNA polymerase factor sigma-32 [Deltaproteobacteria bacterium]